MQRDGSASGGEVVDLWAMAAELERQFAGYKRRLAERNSGDDAPAYDYTGGGGVDAVGDGGVEEAESRTGASADVRGRMYEAYVRRRDERLRQGWRARMERKEAEVKALWAQLELGSRACGGGGGEKAASGGGELTTDDGTAGDKRKTERNDDDKRKSSDATLAPRRISGKKHARTRSFSSSTTTSRSRTDVGSRRALSQEPPPSEPHAAGGAGKDSRERPAGGTATTPTPRPKTSLRSKNSGKGHSKPAGLKLPRSLPRRASSGGLEELSREVVLPNTDAAAPLQSRSSEQAVHGETRKASPPRPFVVRGDSSGGTRAANARAASPELDCGVVVQAVPDGVPEEKSADVEEHGDEKVDASPDKLGNPNGEITEPDTERSYVYVNKDAVEEQAMSLPEPLAASDAEPVFCVKTNEETAEEPTAPTDATAAEIATTNAEEASARESSDETSFSGRSGASPPNTAPPSCSSRDQSIERLLEADAVLLRKKRAEKSAQLKTPGSAGSRVSGTARSPRETVRGFKRFLSFGKKNRGREVTVVDCTSPSVPSVADDDSASGGWQSAGSIKPRMGSSDATSDDTDHGYPGSPRACSLQSLVAASPAKSELAEMVPPDKSPKAHRSFFSFRSLNCGRG